MRGKEQQKTGRAARTAVKSGSGAAGGSKKADTAVRGSSRGQSGRPAEGHRQEIIALVLFGVAVFLVFVLVAGGSGGVIGRGVASALAFAFGRLAFVLPLILIVVAVLLVLGRRIHREAWFVGAMVFLFGLFVVLAAGVLPFGSHGEETFVRADFEARAGGLGEVFYALFHRLVGAIGVGIIGWIALVAGFSLATGLTIRQMGRGTKRAAVAVKNRAEQSALARRNRDNWFDDDGDEDLWSESPTLAVPTGFDGLTGKTAGSRASVEADDEPWFGPRDLVAETMAVDEADAASMESPFGREFDEWHDGRSPSISPVARLDGGASGSRRSGGRGVLDAQEVFSDLYKEAGIPAESDGDEESAAAPDVAGIGEPTVRSAYPDEMSQVIVETASSEHQEDIQRSHEKPEGGQEGSSSSPRVATAPRASTATSRAAAERGEAERPIYALPDADLLQKSTPAGAKGKADERDTATVLLHALSQFGVEARLIDMVAGPRVTRYELQLAPGTKVSRFTNLRDDLAYALASTEIRILAPIPGKSAVGVEVPNQRPDFVTLGDIYREFPKTAGPLMVWLGKDISGKAVYTDLIRMPHLLIAGTTGSGKSGCINCIVSSILLRSTPDQVRMIMIDPKKVELTHYNRIPHLLVPVVTNMKDAAGVLHNVAKEMEDRYELMELERARSLGEMNKARVRRGERPLPYILVVIDELADLMMVSPQEVEEYVIRLAQKSRAVGIHLVVATQRPSADVITGMIKANIPSRIAFAVSSQTDSRVILDVNGAESLLGMGDMLFKPLGASNMQRVQGAYITEEEIAMLVTHWRRQAEPEFREELLQRPPEPGKRGTTGDDEFDPDSDELLEDAVRLVLETGTASVSMLQRRLRVGYTRAGRLIDMLERRGIVGPWEGSKPRQILVDADEIEHVIAGLRLDGPAEDVTVGG